MLILLQPPLGDEAFPSGSLFYESLGLTYSGDMMTYNIDSDADTYMALVEATGVFISSAQKLLINAFYVNAKIYGYFYNVKRLYLPIWGVAAANAIDLITGISGSFNGGVTHGAGFVQGNGTTGYFDVGSSPIDLGITINGGFGLILRYGGSGSTAVMYSAQDSAGTRGFRISNAGRVSIGTTSSPFAQISSTEGSIIIANRFSSSSIVAYKRQGGSVISGTSTSAIPIETPDYNIYCMASNISNVAGEFDDEQVGIWSFGLSLTTQQISDFSLHLQTLWESCTNLSLS